MRETPLSEAMMKPEDIKAARCRAAPHVEGRDQSQSWSVVRANRSLAHGTARAGTRKPACEAGPGTLPNPGEMMFCIPVSAASDEMIVEPVARAIYCAVQLNVDSLWNVECAETRLHYFDLASAAIRALAEQS
jgi:hypothetical protein